MNKLKNFMKIGLHFNFVNILFYKALKGANGMAVLFYELPEKMVALLSSFRGTQGFSQMTTHFTPIKGNTNMTNKNTYLSMRDIHMNAGTTKIHRLAQSGRSMIEMLGVLAIVGVLSIGGIVGYDYAINKHRANETIKDLTQYALLASQQVLQKQPTIQFTELGGTTSLGYPVSAEVLEDPAFFNLSVEDVPVRVCEMILDSDWQVPLVMFANDYAYKNDTSICDKGDETPANMSFQFADDLNPEAMPMGGCMTDEDCKGGCMTCEDRQCVSMCTGSEKCSTDIDTGAQVCCPREKRAGPMCCDSTRNGWCCNSDGQCCPWHKPLVDKNGNCYSCDTEAGVDVTGVEYNCNACNGREVFIDSLKSLCALKCPDDTPLRENTGKCYKCSEEKPINLRSNKSCSDICPNRIANGVHSAFCMLPCDTDEFSDSHGTCHKCSESANIDIGGVTSYGCNSCTNRTQIEDSCAIACGDKQFRGTDGICYDCTHTEPVKTPGKYCTFMCSNRILNGSVNSYCSLPCGEGYFTGTDGKCYGCYDPAVVSVSHVQHTGCEQCENRTQVGSSCIIECGANEFRGSDGVCYDCSEENPIESNQCSDKCPNRTLYNKYCSITCEDGYFADKNGICRICSVDSLIYVNDVKDGCSTCPDTRNKYNSTCALKCPVETPLRGRDNKCYACDVPTDIFVAQMTDACYECPNERKLDGDYCVLK